jgi:hypothetical protein
MRPSPQDELRQLQLDVCAKYQVVPVDVAPTEKLGIARNVRTGELPINGLRLKPEGGTCGWYIWAGGEMSSDADFFVPLHAGHLPSWCELALPFLLLPPGWRFLVAGNHVDVWFDAELK